MHEFPFDGLDIEPTPAQAELIASFRALVAETGIPEPDVIQPRPTNSGAIEAFWIERKLCVVIESEAHLNRMFGALRAEAA